MLLFWWNCRDAHTGFSRNYKLLKIVFNAASIVNQKKITDRQQLLLKTQRNFEIVGKNDEIVLILGTVFRRSCVIRGKRIVCSTKVRLLRNNS